MMRLAAVFMGLALLVTGCTHHGIHVEGDRVVLTLETPRARDVLFASSLDGFVLHEATRVHGSTWEASMPAGSPFSYFYLVDGEVYLPDCPYTELDEFGSANCVYVPGM